MRSWRYAIDVAREYALRFGFSEIEVPHVEQTDLFVRGLGKGTDVVEKELYSFTTRGNDHLSLRPEFTAGIVRAYLQDGMSSWPQPVKLFTWGALFRHDRPQAGRYRQLYQFDVEVLGEASSVVDVQIIQLVWMILRKIGLRDMVIKVNSIGDLADRREYEQLLKSYYREKLSGLCKDCRSRYETNLLRLLDCKEEKCSHIAASAPQILDHLSDEAYSHFKQILEFLDELSIPYILDPTLVRGLDYYNRTVFEVVSHFGGTTSANSLGGGGRYDYLAEQLGGKHIPAVGVGLGLDRLVEEMKRQGITPPDEFCESTPIFIVQLGEKGKRCAARLFGELIDSGFCVAEAFGKKSISSQLKVANKLNSPFALIVGQKEALDDTVIIRDMVSGMQETVDAKRILKEVRKRIYPKAQPGILGRVFRSVSGKKSDGEVS